MQLSIFCLIYFTTVHSFRFVVHPDQGLTPPQLIKKHGYPVETHEVITEDGYITEAYRIPRGKKSTRSGGLPVLFLHGQCGCAENFLISGPNSSTAYYLADRGYDVWLMNNKGNRHGRAHKIMNPDREREFWNFGWNEVGTRDIPAFIDYILAKTNKSKVFYIGHSSGSTSYLAFAAERPEYNEKIHVAVLMAPAAFHTKPIPGIVQLNDLLLPVQAIGILELFPKDFNILLNNVLKTLCSEVTILSRICAAFLYVGKLTNQMDVLTPQRLFESSPAGCAIKGMGHYGQLMKKGTFIKYDYGLQKNMEIYKTRRPPLYNLTNAKAPVALYYAPEDNLVNIEGVMVLAKKLPNVLMYEVPTRDYGHIDFICSKNNNRLINEPMVKLFRMFQNDSSTM